MAISNLISKIKENIEEEAKIIQEKASKEEKQIMYQKIEVEAKHDRDVILEKAKIEAKSKAERIVSRTNLNIRNDILAAKQNMIQKVFDLALDQLEDLPITDFLSMIVKVVCQSDFDGELYLLLSKGYLAKVQPNFIDELNKEIQKQGSKARLIMSKENKDIDSGFVLSQKGLEINYTFKAMISSLREEMEYEITKALFHN